MIIPFWTRDTRIGSCFPQVHVRFRRINGFWDDRRVLLFLYFAGFPRFFQKYICKLLLCIIVSLLIVRHFLIAWPMEKCFALAQGRTLLQFINVFFASHEIVLILFRFCWNPLLLLPKSPISDCSDCLRETKERLLRNKKPQTFYHDEEIRAASTTLCGLHVHLPGWLSFSQIENDG